jgi:hypothetical protein
MAVLVFLLGLGGMYLSLVAMVEVEKSCNKEVESDWDNDSWETQRG